MSHLLETALTAAQRQECEANDAALALGVEVGRIEVSEAEAIAMDLAWQRDRAERDARRLAEVVQAEAQLDEMRRAGL